MAAAQGKERPMAQKASAAHQTTSPTPLGRTSVSLKGQTPHHEIPASLEGVAPPRASPHPARGSQPLA
jgi:hypothetical protein